MQGWFFERICVMSLDYWPMTLHVCMQTFLHSMAKKLITDKYWKHPSFVEALQLERCCERMEIEMSHMLLPLSNLAHEIMTEWKGRLRAVAVINDYGDGEENEDEEGGGMVSNGRVRVLLGWREVPFMRELLRVSNC